jgi:hypothetical protein
LILYNYREVAQEAKMQIAHNHDFSVGFAESYVPPFVKSNCAREGARRRILSFAKEINKAILDRKIKM